MPTVNIYYLAKEDGDKVRSAAGPLKEFLAGKLTCGDIQLSPQEISVRLLPVDGGQMIGTVELEITAHAFPERVQNQDKICLEVMEYLIRETGVPNIKVWLKLCELGHSWAS